jgi:hypothetical protein
LREVVGLEFSGPVSSALGHGTDSALPELSHSGHTAKPAGMPSPAGPDSDEFKDF